MNVTKHSHGSENLVCEICDVDHRARVLFPEESLHVLQSKEIVTYDHIEFRYKEGSYQM